MYKDLIDSINNTSPSNSFNKDSFVYPISEFNLEAIKILIHNCFHSDLVENHNLEWVTINPIIWLPDLLDKNISYIKMISCSPIISILKEENGQLIYKNYKCEIDKNLTETEINDFFQKNKWNQLVIYNITKIADLRTMKSWYNIRYADVTEKYEQIENKINELLQ